MESVFGLIDAAAVATLAVWAIVAVGDNWRFPKMNRDAVATVVRMDLLEADFPDDFAQVAHRRVADPKRIDFLFELIRMAETVSAVTLCLSVLVLFFSAFGAADADFAQGLALLSVMGFAAIWAAFIIGGNWFAYWYCHQWAQSNHFMLLSWSFLVVIILLN
ncbi:MAG: DUF2165 family protein [Pseudomonadota bacterium]